MGNGTGQIAAFLRTVTMLEALLAREESDESAEIRRIAKGRRGEVSAIARKLGVPISSAHRQVVSLIAAGLLQETADGRHVAGARLRRLAGLANSRHIITSVAGPALNRLAARTRSIAQLGSLDDFMVTYHIKTGHGAGNLFTRVGMQMEAYCSGIGKVLLAHLTPEEQATYLADGPFLLLTDRTIIDPEQLAGELERVRARGYAMDDEEIAQGLRCFAAPLRDEAGQVIAAISLSTSTRNRTTRLAGDTALVEMVRETARTIEVAAFGASLPPPPPGPVRE